MGHRVGEFHEEPVAFVGVAGLREQLLELVDDEQEARVLVGQHTSDRPQQPTRLGQLLPQRRRRIDGHPQQRRSRASIGSGPGTIVATNQRSEPGIAPRRMAGSTPA